MELRGKIALITGAAGGIGQATAKELAKSGADIYGVDLLTENWDATSAVVEASGQKFTGFVCDITDEPAVRKLVDEAQALDGGFDILINNAGVLPSGSFVERNFDDWRQAIEVNLTGLMVLTHAVLPFFIQRNRGHIVNIASIAGKFGTEGVVAYAASKHGVVGFSSALRSELADTPIGVSWICPSLVKTRMSADVAHTFLTPLVEPEEVAIAIRKAIETNAIEIFVPRRVRFAVSILPGLLPRLSRSILKWTQSSRGWLDARK